MTLTNHFKPLQVRIMLTQTPPSSGDMTGSSGQSQRELKQLRSLCSVSRVVEQYPYSMTALGFPARKHVVCHVRSHTLKTFQNTKPRGALPSMPNRNEAA